MMWYVLQVLTGQEQAISRRLRRCGFHVAVPMERRCIHTHGKWIDVDYTLLPGYVFVEATMDDSAYYLLKETAGVVRILSTGGRPSPLSAAEAEWLYCLQSCYEKPTVVEYLDSHTYRIVGGFLKGKTGCIEQLDRHRRRIRIKLPLLGEARQLELSYKIEQ